MNNIHPTAIVSSKANIGNNITVGPYSIIHDDVVIGDDCKIGPHVCIYDGARIGNRVTIHQSASVANVPQDLSFKGEDSIFSIGDDTVIREYVTLHRGTHVTHQASVGKNCLIMAYAHVAHDCVVGNNVIIVNAVQLAGHVHVDDYAIVGGGSLIHQFCRVGKYVMLGGGTKITQEAPPFVLMDGNPSRYQGLNVIGLKRRGFSSEDISALKEAYGILYNPAYNVSQAKELINQLPENKHINELKEFLSKIKRGVAGK